MNLLNDWLTSYTINSAEDLFQAKREIMQEITLAGLSRGGFFDHASFYGGTALKIFYGIKRFSEDLDFSLNYKNPDFTFDKYIPAIKNEFSLLGLDVAVSIKPKVKATAIQSAFLKENTLWGFLSVNEIKENPSFPSVKIKIEIDRTPPLQFEYEPKLLLRPYSFYINCMKEEYLFAGKMHALLFRQWKNRVKGRDWYDFEWFVKRGTILNLEHLYQRAIESGHWNMNTPGNEVSFKNLLRQKITNLNIKLAKEDIIRFIENPNEISIWSKQYFFDLVDFIQFSE